MCDTIFENNTVQAVEMPILASEVESVELPFSAATSKINTSRDNSALSLSRKGDLVSLKQLFVNDKLPVRIERCRLAMYAAAKAGHSAVVDWWLNESGVKFNKRSRQAVVSITHKSAKKERKRIDRIDEAAVNFVSASVPVSAEATTSDAIWLKRLQSQCVSIANGCSNESEAISFTNGFYLGVISNMRRSRMRK